MCNTPYDSRSNRTTEIPRRERGDIWRLAAAAAAAALVVRMLLVLYLSAAASLSLDRVVSGHDGGEYIRFAEALSRIAPSAVPVDARRHDAGWALLLTPFVRIVPPWCAVMLLDAAAFLLIGVAMMELIRRPAPDQSSEGASRLTALRVVCALLFAYPSLVYFNCFALAEPAFLAFLLSAIWAHATGRRTVAYLLAGLCTLVRSPGVFLVGAMFAADLVSTRKPRRLAVVLCAALPPAIWWLVARTTWGTTAAETLELRMGLPFCGFRGFAEMSPLRVVYVMMSVLLAVVGICLAANDARRCRWKMVWLNIGLLYSAAYLLFHFCIRTYRNMDAVQYPFSYMDRYMIGVMPFALYGWRHVLTRPVLAVGTVLSICLSAYWGHNYFEAALR